MLGRFEGLWVEPSSATAIAALEKLKEASILQSNDIVVCTLTGSGFKDLEIAKLIGTQPLAVERDINQVVEALNTMSSPDVARNRSVR